jgi:hypothetical protein
VSRAEPVDGAWARRTAEACDTAAARLAEVRRGQSADAAHAADGWLGPHRDHFDRELARTLRRSTQVEARLRRLADQLRARAAGVATTTT